MKHKLAIINLLILFLLPVVILFFYYRGNRNSFFNTTINNFSSQHPQLAINLKKMTKGLDVFYLFHQFIPSEIPTYSLTIKPQDLMNLNTNLPRDGGKLTSQYKKTVAAEFSDGNKIYSVKVRYRGDNPNHWQFSKKSWRINFDKELFDNQESLNLILPEDRYFFIEPWVSYMGKKLGLITPELSFVNLIVNGKPTGVYLKAEQWGKAFLKNYGLTENANLYGEGEFDQPVTNLYSDVLNLKKYTYDTVKPETDTSDLARLFDLINNASDEEFYQRLPEIVDMDNFFHWQAQATLAFSYSQKMSHNLVVYFNPEINKFQFLPWDVAMSDTEPVNPDFNYNPLMTRVLTNPDYMYQRNLVLWNYVKNQSNLDDDLKYFDNLYQTTRGAFYRDSQKIFPNLDFDLSVKKHRRRIISAQNKIKELLHDAQGLVNIQFPYIEITSQGFASLKLSQIELQLDQPVQLTLIKDSNNNQLLDSGDIRVGNFRAVAGRYLIQPENILIHTLRDTSKLNQPFSLKPTKQRFFIIASGKTTASDINLELKNAITDNGI